MKTISGSEFGSTITPLWRDGFLNELGTGSPNRAAATQLTSLADSLADKEQLLPQKIVDRDAALALLSGLWLVHDFLDESHHISQSLENRDGSYWHAIMHRREGDFWNSKYWFRNAGKHPINAQLAADAAEIYIELSAEPEPSKRLPPVAWLADAAIWDAARFVDLVESVESGHDQWKLLCQRIQRREWELLMNHCRREAIGQNA